MGIASGLALVLSLAVSDDSSVDFSREILPILSDNCFVCHGPDPHDDTDLRLDSLQAASEDRGGYRAVDAQHPEASELLKRIHDSDQPMPPADAERQLTDRERELLTRWIKSGGHYAEHWAFVPPERPVVPGPEGGNPIDRFIQHRLAEQNLSPAAEADRAVLARRAALTLTGLPPEPQQLADFLQDSSDDAWDRLITQLLDSPRYGEHQARYWLDAVRYGDTHGLHLDNRRGIYPYRDWVVRALNQNLPLDEFITWQLAGDLLPNPQMDQLVATGYVRLNPTTGEGGVLPEEFQAKNNFDRTENLGTVFLGLSLTCARCHTHKYDPVTQKQYYQLLAFFNSTAEPPLDKNAYEYGPTLKVPADQQAWQTWQELTKQGENLLSSANISGADVATESWEKTPLPEQLQLLAENDALSKTPLGAQVKDLHQQMTAAQEQFTATLVARDLPEPRSTHLLRRGEYNLPDGDPLQPDVLPVLGGLPEDAPRNRLGLAQWLTSRKHPLVARVLINRIWQRIFGDGLVRTPEDFGLQGQQPTHPELLDWLAVELQESGWNLKHMLTLMVTSQTFRQSSAARDDINDPQNLWWSRGPGYRLDAEVLRDVGLWSSQLLDPVQGGEGVKPWQPAGMWKAMAHPASNTKEYVADSGQQVYRRSLYVYWKRTSPHPMMTLFDAPDRESSCVRRGRTSTPLQSLGLLNEVQRIEMGRALATRLIRHSPQTEARLDLLFTLLAGRTPVDQERQVCHQLVTSLQADYEQDPEQTTAFLKTGNTTADPKLPAAELAAWTQLAVTVLASDVAITLY